ncbi:MAG TPA: ATP-binding protein [Nitrospiraceae bacterium]
MNAAAQQAERDPQRAQASESISRSSNPERAQELYAEQIRLLYDQIPLGLAASFLNSILLVAVEWAAVSHSVLLAWLGAVVLITAARTVLWWRYRNASPAARDAAGWGTWCVGGTALSGLAWGTAGIVLFPEESMVLQVFLVFVLGGMVIGGPVVLPSVRPAYLIFIPSVIAPITARLFLMGTSMHLIMGAMTGLFALIALGAAQRAHKTITSSLTLRFENQDLVAYLTRAHKVLADEIAVRERSEEALRERVRLTSFTAEVSSALNRNEAIDEILRACVRAATGHLDAALARIWILEPGDLCGECYKASVCDKKTECLHLRASAGLSTNLNGEYRRVPLGWLKIGRIAQGSGRMHTNDALSDERLPNKDWLRDNGLQSFAGFPLTVDGRVFGVLALFARSPLSIAILQTVESACNGIAALIARRQMEQHARRIEKLALLGQLLGGIAHEIKNPLFILTGHLQLFKDKLKQGEYQALPADLQKIESSAERMAHVTEQFLNLAKPVQSKRQPCSVTAILQQTLDFLDYEISKNHIVVKTAFQESLPDIRSDPRQLQDVFLNLILNAMQAMTTAHGRGTLTVKTARADGWIEVRIQDDGPGITAENRTRLFEPFFSTKLPDQGTGLGLWTVRSVMMGLGGAVQCETEVGVGTTFLVRLPDGSYAGRSA